MKNRILSIMTIFAVLCTLIAVPTALATDDAATITFDMISDEAPSAITKNLTLTDTVGTTLVTWASSNTAVIRNDGTVTRALSDKKVALTATVGNTAKTFDVVVPGTNTIVGSSEGFTKSSDLAEYVIESSGRGTYATYDETTGEITGSDATVSLSDGSMLIAQTGTNQSRVNRPLAANATGLSGMVVVEKRIKASNGFNWYIKATDNMTIAQFTRTGKTVVAYYLNGSSTSQIRNDNYTQLTSNEYVTYKIVLDTNSKTYAVYVNGELISDSFKNIPFTANRNSVAKDNDWLEVYPRSSGNTVNVDYSSVVCYENDITHNNATVNILQDGEAIYKYTELKENASMTVEFNTRNASGETVTAYVCAAVYDGKALKDIRSTAVPVPSSDEGFSATLFEENPFTVKKGNTVKLFCFYKDTFSPVCKTVMYTPEAEIATSEIACWGDSITYGAESTNPSVDSYPAVLSDISGATVYNMGIGGETAATIAARQGGLPIKISGGINLGANAGDSVTVEGANVTDGIYSIPVVPRNVNLGGWNPCELNGIKGTMSASVNSDRQLVSLTFTRSGAGEALVTEEDVFLTTEASKLVSDYTIIYMGVNRGYNDDPDTLCTMIEKMVAKTKNPDKYLVIGLTTGNDDSRAALDAEMKARFGNHFVDLRGYLSSKEAIADAGIEYSEEYDNHIARGYVPSCFWAHNTEEKTDNVHLNDIGYEVMAKYVYKSLIELVKTL